MKHRILVCDDDRGILDMLTLLFQFSGFEIATQIHSIKLFEDINTFKPDLLIIDLWMPGMNGEAVVRQLKSTDDHRHIPIILASAGQDGDRIAEEIHADKFIAKPFDIDKLLEVSKSLLNKPRFVT